MPLLRWVTAGESHGMRLTAILEGIPAGLPLTPEDINPDLARRQRGYGRGGRMKIEHDQIEFLAGVRHGETLGSPLVLSIENRDHPNWAEAMSPFPSSTNPSNPVTRPRPGHADLVGGLKYFRHDLRDILERASARETALRTAVGAVCKKLLSFLEIDIFGHVTSIGPVKASTEDIPHALLRQRARDSELACADPVAEKAMRDIIRTAAHAKDTLGGTFEIIALGAPPGLGSHTQWDHKLDGRLAQAMMSIHAVKGVEIGDACRISEQVGSTIHDPISYDRSTAQFVRLSNHAGGLEGGMTNGQPVVCKCIMKPFSTLRIPLASVDIITKEPTHAITERSDVCAVPAACVVGESMMAIILTGAALEKFGGDGLQEFLTNAKSYQSQVRDY
ncbi:chorismate synthase [Pajaroellobacter abortibovis]|uniref:Chorismate synthase n=1 Tax=Pajaroellobacter abortibovis TaxID=1882918 RepID=A0A1L6MUQ5_9BACT|nr:chorismate synthase [Pajaroellobacter abortibovis]APR99242.1 chorismate synthase [Pajaroellobacter abortibovis]